MPGLEEANKQWAELSRKDDWASKGKLLKEISGLGTPEAERFIVDILNDQGGEYPWVRGIAAACLFTAREERSIIALIRNMRYFITMDEGGDYTEENSFVRAACAEALGENAKWRRANGMPPLSEKYADRVISALMFGLADDVEVCAKAVVALGKFGHSKERVGAIYEAFRKKLSPNVLPVAESFSEMGLTETHAMGIYMAALNSEEPKVAEKMVAILERILQENPHIDSDGRVGEAIKLRKRMLLAQGGKPSESIVDDLLKVRFSTPHVRGTTCPRLPAQKLK